MALDRTSAAPAPHGRAPAPGTDVRQRALRALLAVDEAGYGTQQALRHALNDPPPLQGADRALATELVYGVERRRRPLDAWIEGSCAKGLYPLEAPALAALRLGAYQLAYLERIPDFAAVNATIDAARAYVPERAIGFVHAVLRTLARRGMAGDLPVGDDLPPWLRRRVTDLAATLGLDPEALQSAFRGAAPLHLHAIGPAAAVESALKAAGVPIEPLADVAIPGVWRSEGGTLFQSEPFAQRQVLAQDAASAAVTEWLDVQPDWQVADLAAGRGVKSVALAAHGAKVTAVDIDAAKLAEAQRLGETAGYPLHATVVADGAAEMPLPHGQFDAVLLDAPCTGLGTLRRRPEIRHRRQAADLLRMADLQGRMLVRAADLVKPGGLLLFATCSFAFEEGPHVLERFLRNRPEFQRDPGPALWVRPLLDQNGDLRTHPLLAGMDAFFGARLRRS